MKTKKTKEEIKEHQQRYYQEHKEKIKQYGIINKDKIRVRRKKWRAEHKDTKKHQALRYCFNISLDEYQSMLQKQNGKCAICGSISNSIDNRTKKPRMLSVDHNHITKQVRGLLCNKCNIGIGGLLDSWELLDAASAYIKSYEISTP